MNSLWKMNSIIFEMTLAPIRSDSQIKIRVFETLGVNFISNLVKVDESHRVARIWCRNKKNVVWDVFDQLLLSVNPRLTRDILVNLTWNGTSSASMLEQIAPLKTRCFCGQMKVNIFENFGVRHINWEQTKYGIYITKNSSSDRKSVV